MFFRIRFLDLVVRDVKIISKEHGGVAERPGREGGKKQCVSFRLAKLDLMLVKYCCVAESYKSNATWYAIASSSFLISLPIKLAHAALSSKKIQHRQMFM